MTYRDCHNSVNVFVKWMKRDIFPVRIGLRILPIIDLILIKIAEYDEIIKTDNPEEVLNRSIDVLIEPILSVEDLEEIGEISLQDLQYIRWLIK